MPGWFDKAKNKAEQTLHDQEKMDRIKAKVQDTLHDQEKMDRIKEKAGGVVDKVRHRSPEESRPAPENRVDQVDARVDESPVAAMEPDEGEIYGDEVAPAAAQATSEEEPGLGEMA
jgi:hypothetical protein